MGPNNTNGDGESQTTRRHRRNGRKPLFGRNLLSPQPNIRAFGPVVPNPASQEVVKALGMTPINVDESRNPDASSSQPLSSAGSPMTGVDDNGTTPLVKVDSYDEESEGSPVSSSVLSSAGGSPRVPAIDDINIEDLKLGGDGRKLRKIAKSLQYRFFSRDAIRYIEKLIGNHETRKQLLNLETRMEILLEQNLQRGELKFNAVFTGPVESGLLQCAYAYANALSRIFVPAGYQRDIQGTVVVKEWKSDPDTLLDEETVMETWLKGLVKTIEAEVEYQSMMDSRSEDKKSRNEQVPIVILITNVDSMIEVLGFEQIITEMTKSSNAGLTFVLTGKGEEMAEFEKHPDVFPYIFTFAKLNVEETWLELWSQIKQRWQGAMKVEGGSGGRYLKQLAKRLHAQAKTGDQPPGYIEQAIRVAHERQLDRLSRARRHKLETDVWLLTVDDLLGKPPFKALENSTAWRRLMAMPGLEQVKSAIKTTADTVVVNYSRALADLDPVQTGLSRMFLGPPGTGKTTVAKLYGKILAQLGVLSSGGLIVKLPSDFIGSYIGASAKQTTEILKEAKGKVLLIDEAYMLDPHRSGGKAHPDSYRMEAIDTLVGLVQNSPGEDICVIMAGYEKEMDDMLRDANPGLARRFPKGNAFVFQNFTDDQLSDILDMKLKDQQLSATEEAKDAALDMLNLARMRPNFGNGGEVENMLSRAKASYQARYSEVPIRERPFRWVFEPMDFDPEGKFSGDKTEDGVVVEDSDRIAKMFDGFHGFEETIAYFQSLSNQVKGMRAHGKDPADIVPYTYIFTGPPGTGKTETARKVGKLLNDMALLPDGEVVEATVSDMVAGYVGQTGGKVRNLLDSAIGKVLFIDEAYALNGGSSRGGSNFHKEAVDELVACLTKPEYKGKLAVILAGYTDEMQQLMSVNKGLASRFEKTINFQPLSGKKGFELFCDKLQRLGLGIGHLSQQFKDGCSQGFEVMAREEHWGSARDVGRLCKTLEARAFERSATKPDSVLTLPPQDIIDVCEDLYVELSGRENASKLGWMIPGFNAKAAEDLEEEIL